ncbi:MAG: aminodeoxychorismate synthase component I [Candidatus Omnitrophica bacterium]|nr:aminodeoxychorismate synthase component I [Candidatus Omnitrophota bacterium]
MAYYTWKSYKSDKSPLEIFRALKGGRNCFFLDSSLAANYSLGRYSFLGINPFKTFSAKNRDRLGALREELEKYKIEGPRNSPPFLGGAVGYLAYDAGFLLEKRLKRHIKDDLKIPDLFFAFYNTVIIVDHFKKIFGIFALGFPEKRSSLQEALARENIAKLEKLIFENTPDDNMGKTIKTAQPQSNFSKAKYIAAVKTAKEYIKDGDIYQVNLSQRFSSRTNLGATEIYERLRMHSPAYFGAYFDPGPFQIISSSPERFLSLRKDIVITRPMKGTRPRSSDETEDSRLKNDLLASPKDKAELMMIVDLERNDLGRVCNYDSVKVETLRELEEYNTVFQTTANIYGKLYKGKDRIDLLRACSPGGSITGCPKIRAMEIIEELEPSRRGIYTGALGYLSFSGDMDFNVLIRTILKNKDKIYFGVGGGIVADSNPEEEYNETLVKAEGIMRALSAK